MSYGVRWGSLFRAQAPCALAEGFGPVDVAWGPCGCPPASASGHRRGTVYLASLGTEKFLGECVVQLNGTEYAASLPGGGNAAAEWVDNDGDGWQLRSSIVQECSCS